MRTDIQGLSPTPTLPLPRSVVPAQESTARAWWTAALAIVAIWAAAALAWPLTGSVVPWDSKNHFYPMLRFAGEALANGEWPLWNPFHFSGHPASADPQSLLFTPTMLLFAWLAPSPSMQVFDLVVFAHFLPGALAMVGLFRRRGWAPEGAVVAAAIFVLGGSASARLQHSGIIFGYGMFPLALYLLEEMLERRSYRWSAGFSVVAVLMVLGRDQVAFLSGLALLGLVAHQAVGSKRFVGYLRERAGVLALAGVLGGVLLCVPVILTMQFLMTSTRPAFGYGVAAMGSLPPESFATLLFADVFGSLRTTYDYWGPDWHSLVEGSWTDRATNYLFAGTIPALLLLWQGIAGGRLFASEFRYFLVLGTAVTIYALGRYTPLFSFIFDSLPGVAMYRRPADATFLMNAVLAVAAGYLVHRYRRDGSPRVAALRNDPVAAMLVAVAIALLAAAVACSIVFAARAHEARAAGLDIAFGVGFAALAVLLLRRWSKTGRQRAVLACLLVALTAGELVWRNAASPLNAEPAGRYAVFQDLLPEQLRGLEVLRAELAAKHAAGEHPRVEILGLGGAWQNASMVLGLEDTIGYNPLRLADYERAVGPGENAADPNLRQFPGTFRGYRCRLASLLGLEYLVLDRPIERLPKHFPRLTGAKLLYGAKSIYVYQLASAAPRAYLATRVIPVESDAVLDESETPEFDRAREVLIEKNQVGSLRGEFGMDDDAAPPAAEGSVSITSYRRNSVTLQVDTDRRSVVVLHDIFYPGWEARVDGKIQPILRANLLFRGVEVERGRHVVEFRFRPLSAANLLAAASDLMKRGGDGPGQTITR